MSAAEATLPEQKPALPTLEIVWQQEPHAYVFLRDAEGGLDATGSSRSACPATADLTLARGVPARRVDVRELVALAADPPSAASSSAAARRASSRSSSSRTARSPRASCTRTSTTATATGTRSGARRSTRACRRALAEIAAALPPVAADAFDGDRDAMVHDLYPVVVDRIARDRLRADRVKLLAHLPRRPSALELFVDGLTAPDAVLPPHSGYAALRRQLSRWVYDGLGALARGSEASWRLALHLDERGDADRARALAAGRGRSVAQPAGVARLGGRRHLLVPARERPADGVRAAARGARAAALRARHPLRRRRGDRGAARRRRGRPLPARGDAAARGAGRAGAAAGRVGARAEPAAPRPDRVEPARPDDPLERAPLERVAPPVRLAARGRRRRDHGRGADTSSRRRRTRSSASRAAGTRCAARRSSARCGSSSASAAARGSSTSCAPSRGSTPTRPGSSSAR